MPVYPGTSKRLVGTFKDEDGALFDQDTVTVIVKRPNGTKEQHTGGEIEHLSTGVYRFKQVEDVSGTWAYRMEGTVAGSPTVAQEITDKVSKSLF